MEISSSLRSLEGDGSSEPGDPGSPRPWRPRAAGGRRRGCGHSCAM